MKWDIDKALRNIEATDIPGTDIQRLLLDITLFETYGVKPTPEQVQRKGGYVWCLAIGKQLQRKLFFYGNEIHEAYLKARRQVKKLTPEECMFYGVKVPKKRNTYASAKRKKGARK